MEGIGTLAVVSNDGDGGYCTAVTVDAGMVSLNPALNIMRPAQLTGSERSDIAYTTWRGIAVLLNQGQ